MKTMGTEYSRLPTLVRDLDELLCNGLGSDLVFIIGDVEERERLFAHRSIIGARCRRLKQGIVEDLHSSKRYTEIHLSRFDTENVSNVLQYVYTGTIHLNSSNALPIYDIANELGIPSLLGTVQHHIDTTTTKDIVLPLLQQSLDLGLSEIMTQLLTYVGRNAKEVLKMSQFVMCTPALVDKIVRHEDIQASEYELWIGLIKWGCHRTKIKYLPRSEEEKQTIGTELEFIPHWRGCSRIFRWWASGANHAQSTLLVEGYKLGETENEEVDNKMIYQLLQFRKQHIHCMVLPGCALGNWVLMHNTNQTAGTISPKLYEKLSEIGVVWSSQVSDIGSFRIDV